MVFDQQWDLLAYTGYDQAQDAVVVAFRGTDSHSWGNWINNLKTWRANKMYPVEGHPGAMVHAGQGRSLLAWRSCSVVQQKREEGRCGACELSGGCWCCCCHRVYTGRAGFYDLWTNSCLQRNLTRLVGEIVAAHPTPRLFMTGHSMGGALSNLAALDLKFVHNFTEVSFGAGRRLRWLMGDAPGRLVPSAALRVCALDPKCLNRFASARHG